MRTTGAISKPKGGRKGKIVLQDVPSYDDFVTIGKHISFTERRSQDAERELRQVKLLELMEKNLGAEFIGVVTGITNFGVFVQSQQYLVDGLIRYENLMDDWWDVDERAGVVRGQRTGKKIGIGDVAKVRIVKVDLPRREHSIRKDVSGRCLDEEIRRTPDLKGCVRSEYFIATNDPAPKPGRESLEYFRIDVGHWTGKQSW